MASSPSVPPDRAFLTRQPFAHRGLHGPGVVENSRAAFRAAIGAGHGVECDVRPSADGVAYVFHDDALDRLCGRDGRFGGMDADALDGVVLAGADETVPRLAEMLALVAGRVPLLVELKAERGRTIALCRAVAEALAHYDGEAAVMSFSPEVGAWFSLNAPERARGLVVSEEGKGWLRGAAERRLSVAAARPHFLAYDIRDLPSGFARGFRESGPLLTWTVRSEAQRAVAAAHADQIIYEARA